jgi:hypothetical protein
VLLAYEHKLVFREGQDGFRGPTVQVSEVFQEVFLSVRNILSSLPSKHIYSTLFFFSSPVFNFFSRSSTRLFVEIEVQLLDVGLYCRKHPRYILKHDFALISAGNCLGCVHMWPVCTCFTAIHSYTLVLETRFYFFCLKSDYFLSVADAVLCG